MQTKATELLFLDIVTKQIMVAVQKCCILIQIYRNYMFLTKLWQNYKQMLPVYYIRQGIDTVCECFEIMAITSELHLDKWIMASLPYHLGNNQEKKWPWSKRRFEKIIRHSKGWVTVSYRLTSFRLSVLKSFELVKQQAQSLCLLEHYSISISSSPQLRSAGRLKREERVSAGGLGGLRGAGDGHGVIDSEDAVCCFRCLWIESLCFRQKGSSGGRHNTSSMQEWLLEKKKQQQWHDKLNMERFSSDVQRETLQRHGEKDIHRLSNSVRQDVTDSTLETFLQTVGDHQHRSPGGGLNVQTFILIVVLQCYSETYEEKWNFLMPL